MVTREGRRIIEKFFLTHEGDLPSMMNYQGKEYRIQDITGKLLRDEIHGDAVLKLHKGTEAFWDRECR